MTTRTRTLGASFAASLFVATMSGTALAADTPRFPDDRANHGVGAAQLTQAATRPDDRARHGVGATTAVPTVVTTVERPDDRAASRGPGAFATGDAATQPDDRAGLRGPGATVATPIVTSADGGFDWGDAGIGAFGGAGIALLLIGAVALVASRRDDTHVALR